MTWISTAGLPDEVDQKPQHKNYRKAGQEQADDLLSDEHGIAPSVLFPTLGEVATVQARPEKRTTIITTPSW
jgi:hypothetical protein